METCVYFRDNTVFTNMIAALIRNSIIEYYKPVQELFKQLPSQRKLPLEAKEEAEKLIELIEKNDSEQAGRNDRKRSAAKKLWCFTCRS